MWVWSFRTHLSDLKVGILWYRSLRLWERSHYSLFRVPLSTLKVDSNDHYSMEGTVIVIPDVPFGPVGGGGSLLI